MKYSVAILALAAAVSAQSIEACDGKAQKCIEDAMEEAGVCEDPKDWACGCENMETIQSKATSCVIEACGGASGALEVIDEVKEICANLPEDGGEETSAAEPTDAEPTDAEPTDAEPTEAEPTDAEPTDAEPTAEPTDGGEEPQPSGEEPAPTDDCEDDEETAEPSGEEPAPTGGEEEEPQTSGEPEEPETSAPPTAGAGMLAPIGSLVVGLFAFAL